MLKSKNKVLDVLLVIGVFMGGFGFYKMTDDIWVGSLFTLGLLGIFASFLRQQK